MIPFLDLAAHHRRYEERFQHLLEQTLRSSAFVGGDHVERFEQAWADACGTSTAVGVANGTDAIELALVGLGIGHGDEVIVPANTFVATAAAVVRVGARPVFCDVEPGTLLLSPRTVEEAWSPDVAAVIAVHLFGQPADMAGLRATADRRGVALVEDAAQAHLARWDGTRVGGLGDVATFSFYPGKNLGALGDGGAVTTNDLALGRRIRELANHGRPTDSRNGHVVVGRNSRLDSLQAAFLSEKLEFLDDDNSARRRLHDEYAEVLPDSVTQVAVDDRATSVHHLEVVRTAQRDSLVSFLDAWDIGHGVHYPTPCHLLPPFSPYRRADLPVAERAAGEIISLPMFPELGTDAVGRVGECIRAFAGDASVMAGTAHLIRSGGASTHGQ